MLLALDIGNTTIHAGLFNGSELVREYRIETNKKGEISYYKTFFSSLAEHKPDAISISSVVPEINKLIAALCAEQLSLSPFFITPKSKTGITISCDDLGSDRLANCVAGYNKAKGSCIIVDFGTAITFEVVSKDGKFLGGAIAPGVQLSFNALIRKASQLNTVPLVPPDHAVANGTEKSVQSGIIFGFASLADGMIARMNNELNDTPMIFITGGQGKMIAEAMKSQITVVPELTLDGIRILWEINKQ